MFREHQRIVLTADIPAEGLKAGDVGTIVHVYRQGEALEVEFLTLEGGPAAIATVQPGQVRPVTNRDITHARLMERSALG